MAIEKTDAGSKMSCLKGSHVLHSIVPSKMRHQFTEQPTGEERKLTNFNLKTINVFPSGSE